MAHSPWNQPHQKKGSPAAAMAHGYFSFLARSFPVMCSSDEFHFMPRAEEAENWLDRLDDLSPEAVEGTCDALRSFQADFKRFPRDSDLETAIDLEMLSASCSGLLIELEQHCSWKNNPLLYLKIVFIGLDQALKTPCPDPGEQADRIRGRLSQAARLLGQACMNLETMPASQHAAALNMIEDGRAWLQAAAGPESLKKPLMSTRDLDRLDQSLHTFTDFLQGQPAVPDSDMARDTLESTLRDHFLDSRTLQEIEELADQEAASALNRLRELQALTAPGQTWQELYHALDLPEAGTGDAFSLYSREIGHLQNFFSESVFGVDPGEGPLELVRTPLYLNRVRSSASFCAALTRGETSFFFLSPGQPDRSGSRNDLQRSQRLNREFHFLTAHETIPGHHLLDTRRRGLTNPVRRQLESPLFYEGWATYAETLLLERGYLQGRNHEFLEEKRRLWRAARCLIDLRRHSGAYDRDGAARLLVQSGFSRHEAFGQVDRFQLNPGYQICYTAGLLELQRLRRSWGPSLGEDRFHELVLSLGEIPFDRLEDCLRRAAETP